MQAAPLAQHAWLAAPHAVLELLELPHAVEMASALSAKAAPRDLAMEAPLDHGNGTHQNNAP